MNKKCEAFAAVGSEMRAHMQAAAFAAVSGCPGDLYENATCTSRARSTLVAATEI